MDGTYVCRASYSTFADVVYSYISIQVEGSAVGILSQGRVLWQVTTLICQRMLLFTKWKQKRLHSEAWLDMVLHPVRVDVTQYNSSYTENTPDETKQAHRVAA